MITATRTPRGRKRFAPRNNAVQYNTFHHPEASGLFTDVIFIRPIVVKEPLLVFPISADLFQTFHCRHQGRDNPCWRIKSAGVDDGKMPKVMRLDAGQLLRVVTVWH